jgi:hypothetical protein
MTALLAAAIYCSAQTADAWANAHGNLNVLPVKPCYIQGLTGVHRCSRKIGCLNCGPYPCPELGIKGAQ